MTARPAAFLDRDGVLNVDVNYAHRPEQIVWIDGAHDAVRFLNEAGYYVFVVTNQAGVGRGFYSEDDVVSLHSWMAQELAGSDARIDAWRYCPTHPEAALDEYRRIDSWRKPGPGMLVDLLGSFDVDAERSFLIGDNDTDVQAAEAAGIVGHKFAAGNLAAFVRDVVANG